MTFIYRAWQRAGRHPWKRGGSAVITVLLLAPLFIQQPADAAFAPTSAHSNADAPITIEAAEVVMPVRAYTPLITHDGSPHHANNFVAPIERLIIPEALVDAPLIVLGFDISGFLEIPYSPTQVGWYDFTGKPGFGSNAVFTGHIDYVNYGPAVFWNLKDLMIGDEIQVRLIDGILLRYEVVSTEKLHVSDIEMDVVLAPTVEEHVTIISCSGIWEELGGGYSHRIIVRALFVSAEQT
ncbi:MAG TPA: class F sortase [Dehalococcoidia bacterium]|nr:class F sortase [Dehalococcoidia bacterium]